MKAKTFLTLFLAVALVTLSGCTIAKIGGKGAVPILLNQPQVKVEVIENLKVSKQIMFDYTGFYDVSEIISEVTAGKNVDAIINCQVSLKATVADFFVNLFTLGIANSKTIEITGQLVKLPEGMGSLDIEKNQLVDIHRIGNSVSNGIILLNN